MADIHDTLVKFDIIVGETVTLSPLVRRITAPNPSAFTGPGTNTYIVGHGDDVAVIDPGPNEQSHIDAILKATDGKIRWLIATHTHEDHSPAAKPLQEATGAEMVGVPFHEHHEHLDETFVVDKPIQEGDIFKTKDYSLRTIATPGHVSNHMSFLLEEEMVLFAGDHIMQGATVVIVPPHGGTMWDYFASLDKLKGMGIKWLAPAHGHILNEADKVVTELKAHRQTREDKAKRVLREVKKGKIEELAPLVYPEVEGDLIYGAKVALYAHLQKLVHEGFATRYSEKHWIMGEEIYELVEK